MDTVVSPKVSFAQRFHCTGAVTFKPLQENSFSVKTKPAKLGSYLIALGPGDQIFVVDQIRCDTGDSSLK